MEDVGGEQKPVTITNQGRLDTALSIMTELESRGALEKPPVIELSSGAARIEAAAGEDSGGQLQEDFRLIESGLKLLAHHYPEQIEVTVR